MVLGFAKYSKKSYTTKVMYTLKNHRAFISKGVKNGWAFEMVACSSGKSEHF